tara:strand:- start:180 stop:800 length:621 start_codon:yes stop_codon:yes gene_type:complete
MVKMKNNEEIEKLLDEDVNPKGGCNLCKESGLDIGKNAGYGIVIYSKDGWFATLSPKTGGNPEYDFTIQLMPKSHLTHFSQVESHEGLSSNYGIAFSRISRALTTIMMQDQNLKAGSDTREQAASVATWGKSTNWKEKKEHLHIKIFPFRDNLGQPSTVDSSFSKKEILKDDEGKEFVKMNPVKKTMIDKGRLNKLSKDLIRLLNN